MKLIRNQWPNADKIYLYIQDPLESKYQWLINGREKVGINKLKNQTKYVLFLSWNKNFLLISKLLVWSINFNLPRLFEGFSGVINRESHVQFRKIWDKLTSKIFENSKSLPLHLTNFENLQKTQSINLFQILITNILWHKKT